MASRKSIIWQIFPQYLLLIFLALAIIAIYASDSLRDLYLKRTQEDLESRSTLIGRLISAPFSVRDVSLIDRQIHTLADQLDVRITVILPDGVVIADSNEDYQMMENHSDRPEIRTAHLGKTGISARYSYTLGQKMLYVAVPVYRDSVLTGIVRTSLPATTLKETLGYIYKKILFAGFIVIFIAAFAGYLYAHKLRKPIAEIKKAALQFGNGDLTHHLYITKPEELKTLADSMNLMADQLKDRIKTITEQRNELESMLSNMVESVLVVDREEHIIRMNHAMGRLFNVVPEMTLKKNLHESIRNIEIQKFIQRTLKSETPQQEDIIVLEQTGKTVQAHGTLLKDASGKSNGCLIVLNDITKMKALESIRREFVANVSHELKTPITAIHGFVETLRDGAIKEPENAERFLDIIIKHTNRLDAIIGDLLNLSRIEQEVERKLIDLTPCSIQDVLEEAISICRQKANEKYITITLNAPDDLKAMINAPLLEQAIVNLLDNAIKYSSAKGIISILAEKTDNSVQIKVKDNGIGIPERDLPRIFERFYRVDKARSRALGGTGLGLSIVKHIVQAHGGQLNVESKPGKGSTFTLSILP